jgi:hypothetical protein
VSTDIKKHTSIAAAEKPTRAALAAAFLSINDIVPVANGTEANQVAAAIVAAGGSLSSTPLAVRRADAPGLHSIELTTDGASWAPASGVLHFSTLSARDTWTTSYSSLLVTGDRCVVGGTTEFRWRYGGWVPVDPMVVVSTTGLQSGITAATAVTGMSLTFTLPGTSTLRVTAGLTHYATAADTVLSLSVKDGASTLTTWTRQANSSPSTASTGHGSNFMMIIPGIASGSHTLTLEVARAAGTGTISVAPAANNQSFFSVEVI